MIICSTHNLTRSEGLLKVSSISGLTCPKTAIRHCLIADAMISWSSLPIPEEVCTSVHRCSRIEFRILSPAEYSKHNSTGFRSGEFGGHKSGVRWSNCRALFRHDIVKLKIENSLTTVKVMTKTKVTPFYLGHGVVLCVKVDFRK